MPIKNTKLRELYRQRRAAGLCVNYNCPNIAIPGRTRCETHAAYQLQLNHVNRKNWKRATNEERRGYWAKIKAEVIAAYGGKCACCGEDGLAFLTIDHKLGNGVQHRLEQFGRKAGVTRSLYLWLRRNKWPSEFQILCYNCNFGKGDQAECPHMLLRRQQGAA